MNRRGLVGTLSLSALLFVGCSGDSGRVARLTTPLPPTVSPLTVNLDDLDYEEFSGTLQPGQSGGFYDYMTTWGRNCLVSLIVPAESVPPEGPPITYTVSLPTRQSYLDHPELEGNLVVRMAPDGMRFLGPILAQVTWMPWEAPNAETPPPSPLFFYNGADTVQAEVVYVSSINRYRVTFEVDHFSDWETDPLRPARAPEPDPISATYRPNTW